jgi:hypothetical protein
MNTNVSTLLVVIIILGVATSCQRKQVGVAEKRVDQSAAKSVSKVVEPSNGPSGTSIPPEKGYVPDEQTAITIAVAVWTPIYGKSQIEKEKPYRAKLSNGVWTVTGTIPDGYDGGTAVAEISQEDGRILKVIHYQ